MKNSLNINKLNFSFGAFHIGPLTLSMEPGSVCLLTGPNGSGKSSIVNVLVESYNNPNVDITFDDKKDFREDIGFIPDSFPFEMNYTPKIIALLLSTIYKNWDWTTYQKLLDRFEIDPKQKFKKMSVGKLQRFQVAIALSHQAKLLVFDEATEGIDPATRYDIMQILNDYLYKFQASAVISTHNVQELGNRVDYVIYLQQGIPLIATDIESFYDEASTLLEKRDNNGKVHSIHDFVEKMQGRRIHND